MDDGPVPSFALNLAKRNSTFVSPDWIAEFDRRLTTDDSDGYVRLSARSDFSDDLFSQTDLECLDNSIEVYADMPFLQLWRTVHRESAYKAVYRPGTSTLMPVTSLIPANTPGRDGIVEYLEDTAYITDI
jgi:hypothetical protein